MRNRELPSVRVEEHLRRARQGWFAHQVHTQNLPHQGERHHQRDCLRRAGSVWRLAAHPTSSKSLLCMKTPGGTFVATRSAMWFGGLYGVVKTVTLGVLGYVSLVALVRISGKRTLAKMNAFDLVITVATLEGVNGADATLPNQRFTVSRAN